MNKKRENPFESIESAHEFVTMLSEEITEAKREIEEHIQLASQSPNLRSKDALQIAHYNLLKLEGHLNNSSRILNDLRTLRRLMFSERPIAVEAQEPADDASTELNAPVAPVITFKPASPTRFTPATVSPAPNRVRAASASHGSD